MIFVDIRMDEAHEVYASLVELQSAFAKQETFDLRFFDSKEYKEPEGRRRYTEKLILKYLSAITREDLLEYIKTYLQKRKISERNTFKKSPKKNL